MRTADREGRFTGRMSPVENGECLVFERTEVEEVFQHGRQNEVMANLCRASGMVSEDYSHAPMNTAAKLRTYNKYVPMMIKQVLYQQELIGALAKEVERLSENNLERGGKRWDQDEDETLIELAADDSKSVAQIAIMMGRTPAAIQSRITHLVGINRISSEVAGRFVGTLDGEDIEGVIEGTLTRQKRNGGE